MRHATKNKPPRIMAPATPTTTPMTVFRVLLDMLEDLVVSPLVRDAALVAVEEEEEVDAVKEEM